MRPGIKLASLLFVLTASAAASHAQTPTEISWETIQSEGGEYSVALPAGYIIHKDSRWSETTLAGGLGRVSFTVWFRKTPKASEAMGDMHKIPLEKGEDLDYKVGKVKIHVNPYTGKKTYRIFIAVATANGFYGLTVVAPSANDPVLLQILASLNLEGKALMKSTGGAAAPQSKVTIDVGSLESSPIVRAALDRKQTEPIAVDLKTSASDVEDEEEILYSRGVMAVEKPKARYTDQARTSSVQGSITLRILFKANGQIGRIRLVKGLRMGLNEEAIEAAKKIKFVPAEIDGKPVDAERNLVYTFSIY